MTNKPDEPELTENQKCVLAALKAVWEGGLRGGRPYLSYEGLTEQLRMDEAELSATHSVYRLRFCGEHCADAEATRRRSGNACACWKAKARSIRPSRTNAELRRFNCSSDERK